ncbi:hypothetical protein [Haliangium sp.]|uniref:hypothetical protein n=1 Tax=Haliangium sp. TaxID=2663208 RepID=UPI003D1303BC
MVVLGEVGTGLVARVGVSGERYGQVVAMSAHTIAVGAPATARVYVHFRGHDGHIAEEVVLEPDGVAPGFGASVAVWGDYVAVGAPGEATVAGSVHVFERVEERDVVVWLRRGVVRAGAPAPGDRFGAAVSLRGDTMVVGAPGAEAAYAFVRLDDMWIQLDELRPSPVAPSAGGFGSAVAVWRDRVAVSAPGADPDMLVGGQVEVFSRRGDHWQHEARLSAPEGFDPGGFGRALALWDQVLAVGAPGRDAGGGVHVFVRDPAGAWSAEAAITPPSASDQDFGATLSMHRARLAVPSRDVDDVTRIHVFERRRGAWHRDDAATIEPPESSEPTGHDGDYGAALALTDSTLLVAAPRADTQVPEAGVVHVYELPSTELVSVVLDCADADTLVSLVACIRGQMPRRDSEGFVPPTAVEQEAWRGVVADMLAGGCDGVLPVPLTGVMLQAPFLDLESGNEYCVLMEGRDADIDGYVDRGWGTFITNRNATRALGHQAPHPYFEAQTAVQAVDVFKGTDSRSFLMCGSHRYANQAASACDPDYHESDCVHAVANMYYPTVVEIARFHAARGEPHSQIQWHGLADSSCPGIDAYLSPGRASTPPAGANVLTLQAHAQADHPGWVVEVPGTGVCQRSGTRNTAGRYLNGVSESEVCTTSASAASGQFVHVEQKLDVRSADAWIPAVSDTWSMSGPPAPPPSGPDPVTGLSARAGKHKISLSWEASAGASSYLVERGNVAAGPYVPIASVTDTFYRDDGLLSGLSFYYVVSAVDDQGQLSPRSAPVSATVR